MTSRKISSGSPLSSLINQWSQQPEPRQSYRLLLQSTTGLPTRIQAADGTAEAGSNSSTHVYRRAGLRTPVETATRDLLGGLAWMQRIMELAQNSQCHVILVRTQTRDLPWPQSLLSQLSIIDASKDPWGWDKDTEEKESMNPSLNDLEGLYQAILEAVRQPNQPPVLLVWESLAPLFLVHGFKQTLRFLELLPSENCLHLWSVRVETLTATQHAQLEDASQALLSLQGGEMTLMRQGVREMGNILRVKLPFRLMAESGDCYYYRLEEEDDSVTVDTCDETTATTDAKAPASKTGVPVTELYGSSTSADTKRSKPKIQLRHEEDDAPPAQTAPSTNRPRIYMQDDDPEFDDLDEEDPDDDLDI